MLKALARLAQSHACPRTGSQDENPSSACSGLASSDAPNLSARRDELFELTELLNAVRLGPQGDGDILVVFDARSDVPRVASGGGIVFGDLAGDRVDAGAGVRSFGIAGPSPEVSDGRESKPRTADEGEKAVRHTLNLWRHELGEVPEWVWQQTELRVLILANNGLTALPPGIGRLHRLTTLDLGHNALTSVPDELGNLNELSDCLYLHDNQLTRIPDTLGKLTRLRYLNIGENSLTTLPEAIVGMTSLIEFRAQHNRLATLPDSIGQLHNLRELWLRGNAIEHLPPSTAHLHQLRHLDLRENSVAELPPSLAGLPRLRQIDLRSNRLSRLPDWLTLMPSLEKLDLRWNEIDPSLPLLAELDRQGCVVLT